MKIKMQNEKNIEVCIERYDFGYIWLRVGQQALVGFSGEQLRDVDLALARVELVARIAFEMPFDDTEEWWMGVVAALEAEYKSAVQASLPRQPMKRLRASAGRR
jgi:hypothetical protein